LSVFSQISISIEQTNETVIYVDDDNTEGPWDGSIDHPFQFIQDGIDHASDGDTVFVFNGGYVEQIEIYKSVNLVGESNEDTIIDGNEKGDVVCITVDSVNISGFTIKNSGNHWTNAGIRLNSNNSVICENVVSNNNETAIELSGSSNNTILNNSIALNSASGISLYDTSNDNEILGNNIAHNGGNGIFLSDSKGTYIVDNNVDSNGDGGIEVTKIFDARVNTYILRNRIANNGDYGISVPPDDCVITDNQLINDGLFVHVWFYDGYGGNQVKNNTVNGKSLVYLHKESDKNVEDDAGQLIVIDCQNITISSKKITDSDIGIQLWGSGNCSIKNNFIQSCSRTSLYVGDSNNNTIQSNLICDSDVGIDCIHSNDNAFLKNDIRDNGDGLELLQSHRNEIKYNRFNGNNIGFFIESFMHEPNCIGNVMTYNNITNNRIGVSIDYGLSNSINYNNFHKNSIDLTFWAPKHNDFNYNYWGRSKLLPKVLFGTTGNAYFQIPWIAFDFHPAVEPFDIG